MTGIQLQASVRLGGAGEDGIGRDLIVAVDVVVEEVGTQAEPDLNMEHEI
jgi:hypothetical protein